MTKRFGFTLAEVLITLGIIGVVAAMTIPTLIANTNGAKFRSQFKKTLSTLNQAGLMAQAQYDFDYAGANACSSTAAGNTENPSGSDMTFCAILNGTLTGQTSLGLVSGITDPTKGEGGTYALDRRTVLPEGYTGYVAYSLADGSIVAFSNAQGGTEDAPTAKNCTLALGEVINGAWITNHPQCLGFIDVNGITLPNREVDCTDGDTANTVQTPCRVENNATDMTDVFPILFHDATVEPASNAAKYVLTSSK